MISWMSGLSLRGKMAACGAFFLGVNLLFLPFGIIFPKLLIISIVLLLVSAIIKILSSSEKNETLDLSKLQPAITANLQFKIQSYQAGPLLHAAAHLFDPGIFRNQSDELAQTIATTKLYESGKKQFKVSYEGKTGATYLLNQG